MKRILKIYEMLSKDDVTTLTTLLPVFSKHISYNGELEVYKFIDKDITFTFNMEQISKLSCEYEITITSKYLVINK